MERCRLVFDKNENMDKLVENLYRNEDLYRQVKELVDSRFTVKDNTPLPYLHRAFHHTNEYESQLRDIQTNNYHFNAYYIDKFDERSLKNFGAGFYLLEDLTTYVQDILKYRIRIRYYNDNCKCAELNYGKHELLMIIDFKEKIKDTCMSILEMSETEFQSCLGTQHELFFSLIYAYLRSLEVKFVLYSSETYQTKIFVYIDEDCQCNPFEIIDSMPYGCH